MKDIQVNICSIVDSGFCVDSEDGVKVFENIKNILEQDNKAIISFENVEMLTSAFLNTAIGRLYGTFDHEKIKNSLKVKDIQPDDKLLLKKVTDTAKAYFKDKEKTEKAVDEILGD